MPRYPKCKCCGKEVIKDKQEWVQNYKGYFHKECFDAIPPRTIKCAFCEKPIIMGQQVRLDDKNYHSECAQLAQDKKDLFAYCCTLWGLKAVGPQIANQAKQYYKQGYSFKGMRSTLYYFYEIKHNDKNKYKGKETIGIIPYVYEEAKQYFETIEHKKQQISYQIEHSQITSETITIKKTEAKKKPLYDF